MQTHSAPLFRFFTNIVRPFYEYTNAILPLYERDEKLYSCIRILVYIRRMDKRRLYTYKWAVNCVQIFV